MSADSLKPETAFAALVRRVLARGYRAEDLAAYFEVSPSTIRLWASGERIPPEAMRGFVEAYLRGRP